MNFVRKYDLYTIYPITSGRAERKG
jgi:hypothetical protein